MTQLADPPRPTSRVAIPLTVLVALIATAVAYYAVQGAPQPPAAPAPGPAVTAARVQGTVRSIALPTLEVELPPGPHQREFTVACASTCHSAQLVLNQPPFTHAKWGAIVQKMVKTFGAPIAPADEPALVEYLVAIRGK